MIPLDEIKAGGRYLIGTGPVDVFRVEPNADGVFDRDEVHWRSPLVGGHWSGIRSRFAAMVVRKLTAEDMEKFGLGEAA